MTSTRLALYLTFAFLFYGAKVTFTNRCTYIVWLGNLTSDPKPQLSTTDFELASGVSNSVYLLAPWSGRFRARTGCSNNNGRLSCATGDCASGQVGCNGAGAIPPAILIEIIVADNGGQDFYDVSNMDGFSVPMSVTPQGGSGECKTSSCPTNINAMCPMELQLKGSDGSIIACKSAFLAFNQPQYCCTGEYGTADKCPPTNYSQIFEQQCPDAYSYSYDDKSNTFTCSARPDYAFTFCP